MLETYANLRSSKKQTHCSFIYYKSWFYGNN